MSTLENNKGKKENGNKTKQEDIKGKEKESKSVHTYTGYPHSAGDMGSTHVTITGHDASGHTSMGTNTLHRISYVSFDSLHKSFEMYDIYRFIYVRSFIKLIPIHGLSGTGHWHRLHKPQINSIVKSKVS